MKKFFGILLLGALAVTTSAQNFGSRSFLNPLITSVTVSNAASGALGYYTNLTSVGASGTNSLNLSWTNSSGIWVITTNNVPATVTGISFVTNDTTQLFVDVPLYTDRNAASPAQATNTLSLAPVSGLNVAITVSGASGATGANLNLAFIGIPDGTNEPTTGTVGSGGPIWTVGITPNTTSTVTIYTNVPTASFAGCKYIRVQTIKSAITSAANIGVTVKGLSLNGFIP